MLFAIFQNHTTEWLLGVAGAIVISLLTWLGSRVYENISSNRKFFSSRVGIEEVTEALKEYTLTVIEPIRSEIRDIAEEVDMGKAATEQVKLNTYTKEFLDGRFAVQQQDIAATKQAINELRSDVRRMEDNMSTRFDKVTEDIHEIGREVQTVVVSEIRKMMREKN